MIKLERITKKYGNRVLYCDFSRDFPDKGLICFVGPSGCGKSTLLNIISGVDQDFSGSVVINGTTIDKLSQSKKYDFRIKNIGYVFQTFNLIGLDTVFNNVLLPLDSCSKASKYVKSKRANDVLKLVGIEKLAKQRVNKLSGGEKQRVAISRAIINEPSVVLCDEPTGALDEKTGIEIFTLLKQISKRTLVIIATHDLDLAQKYADEILEITNSKVTSKQLENEMYESQNILIGSGKKKKTSRVSFWFKIRHSFQKIKAKKFRSLIVNLMLSLSLTGTGLSMILANSVSTKVNDAFKSILNGNQVVVSMKNENENSFSNVYSTSFNNVYKIYEKYYGLLDGYGVNYMVNFEDFFKNSNYFYVASTPKRITLDCLSARSINDFKWATQEEARIYYPYDFNELDDDQIVLGLNYTDMVNLCFQLQIQRNFTSLGHYIYEKGLSIALHVENENWQYDDEQIFQVMAVCESNTTTIFHTNQLWNEIVFEEMMRIPSDDDEQHDFPWEMYKIYYLKTKGDCSLFLNASLYDEYLYDYVLERTTSDYNPLICKPYSVCDENRVYVYSVDKQSVLGNVAEEFKKDNQDFHTYYFTSDYGYASYNSNLFSGFSKNIFIGLNEKDIDDAIDAETQLDPASDFEINLPSTVVQGNYLLSLGDGVRFSTCPNEILYGREASNLNEIVISKGLAERLDPESLCFGKYLSFAGIISENYTENGQIFKTYNKAKVLVVGISDETKNYIYHNSNWTISFFRDKLGVSSFSLIPKSIVFEFKTEDEANKAFEKLKTITSDYKIESPLKELQSNLNSTLDYANTILIAFSLLASVISILLLGTVMMLNIIESKDEILMFKFLGVKKQDINSSFTVQAIIQGLLAFLVSAIELIVVDFLITYSIGDMMNIDFKFSFNSKPILVVFLLALIVPFVISKIMLFLLNKRKNL